MDIEPLEFEDQLKVFLTLPHMERLREYRVVMSSRNMDLIRRYRIAIKTSNQTVLSRIRGRLTHEKNIQASEILVESDN